MMKGIVSGQFYDSATPYTMTQSMRENFMSSRLLTSQSISHGLVSVESSENDQGCQLYLQRYLQAGKVGFDDGTVCGAPFTSACAFGSLFGLCEVN